MQIELEVPKRLPPRAPVRHRLFALSGNMCAFPGCTSRLVAESGEVVGQICHIEAAERGGERFNPLSNNEARRDFDNLILLCYQCHIKTNDVVKFPTERMRQIKRQHEASATLTENIDFLAERFVDESLWREFKLPSNYGQIHTDGCGDGFFAHAATLLTTIARLPLSTRSFYAQAFIKALRGDLYLCGNLTGLRLALNSTYSQISGHISILQEKQLLGLVDEEDDWMKLPFSGTRYGLSGLDREDNGIYLLYLIHKRFESEPWVVINIFENLEFSLLDTQSYGI